MEVRSLLREPNKMNETSEQLELIRKFTYSYVRLLADAPDDSGESLADLIRGLVNNRIPVLRLVDKILRELQDELSSRHGDGASGGRDPFGTSS